MQKAAATGTYYVKKICFVIFMPLHLSTSWFLHLFSFLTQPSVLPVVSKSVDQAQGEPTFTIQNTAPLYKQQTAA